MSYLLDRKNKRKKLLGIGILILLSALFFYFRNPIFKVFSTGAQVIFRPVLVLKNKTGGFFSGIGIAFSFKSTLVKENEDLRNRLLEADAMVLNYNVISLENTHLKEVMDRKGENMNVTLSAILSKPNKSPYDTLVIDSGLSKGISEGDVVFALGNIPIGKVAEVYENSSKVVLFSTSAEKTESVLENLNTFAEIVGRGGGNFELILPRDFSVSEGTVVSLPGISSYTVATVATVISDPRDAFSKTLLVSPVNIQQLKFVQVAK